MTAVITALVGLVGVLVGVLLSFFLQRRLWQTQEAMKAYSELFAVGDETLRRCNDVLILIGEPEQAHEHNRILHEEYDPTFRRLLRHCWMLERDASVRQKIEGFQQKYIDCKVGLNLRLAEAADKRKGLLQQQIAQKPPPDSLFPLLESLQREVAAKYFHGGAPSNNGKNDGSSKHD